MAFIRGRDLCRAFFPEAAKPLLDEAFPKLTYSAGLLGYGSDVLGYDDAAVLFVLRSVCALQQMVRNRVFPASG